MNLKGEVVQIRFTCPCCYKAVLENIEEGSVKYYMSEGIGFDFRCHHCNLEDKLILVKQ